MQNGEAVSEAAGSGAAGSDDVLALAGRTFEELVGELEQVARAMDAPELGIEEAADLYERAGALHRAASDRLAQVQARLESLRQQDPGATR